MASGQTRLGRRFYDEDAALEAAKAKIGTALDAAEAQQLGLVTSAPDDIDWADEVRLAIEERVSMSPDALTAMEANLRFDGPETMATRVFGRLTAWQNWIFQRPERGRREGRAESLRQGREGRLRLEPGLGGAASSPPEARGDARPPGRSPWSTSTPRSSGST